MHAVTPIFFTQSVSDQSHILCDRSQPESASTTTLIRRPS
jgi:hypothetical protein